MNILLINTSDIGGGAEHDARNLLTSYKSMGHNCWMVVKKKHSNDSGILEIPDLPLSSKRWGLIIWTLRNRLKTYEGRVKGIGRLRAFLRSLVDIHVGRELRRGMEDFYYPGSKQLLDLHFIKPQIIHAHNLHGDYFDLKFLKVISQKFPVFLTLHDQWLITGHCAYSFNCEKWKIGCGNCPDLSIYPSIKRDATSNNWKRKRAIYLDTFVYLSTPSQWLMRMVEQSIIYPAIIEARVVPYGIELDVFRMADKRTVRHHLDIDQEDKVLLYVANRFKQNVFKDYDTLRKAVYSISKQSINSRITIIALGDSGPSERINHVEIRFVPYQKDQKTVAAYYQAADIYLHTARADNFPLTVLEALACGTPVVASAVGGIPEQIRHGETGFLTPPGDAESIALYSLKLLQNNEFRKEMGHRAAKDAHLRFDRNREVDIYLDWYQEVLDPLR